MDGSQSELLYNTIGKVVALSSLSPLHNRYSLGMFHRRFAAPISLRQYELFQSKTGQVLGFVAWAYLSAEDLNKAHAAVWEPVQLADWNTGDHLFFAEFIAVAGMARTLVGHLRRGRFRNHHSATSLRVPVSPSGDIDRENIRIHHWRGLHVYAQQPPEQTEVQNDRLENV